MKILLLSLICCFIQGSSFRESKIMNISAESGLHFDHDTYNAGNIQIGKPISHVFTCTNTSNTILIITRAQDGCSCTNIDHSKEPIKPCGTGTVTVAYNASSPGRHTFYFNISSSDTEKDKILRLYATVADSIR